MALSPETETHLILSTLRAYLNPDTCWGITMPGWEMYAGHWSPMVRAAVEAHPYKFTCISYAPPYREARSS